MIRVLVALAALLVATPAAHAAKLALVIGNGAYKNSTPLTNPTADAEAFASFLAASGFVVTHIADASGPDMLESVAAFGESVTAEDDVVFYYAGHGLQLAGENWLIGVDATLRKAEDVAEQGVGLNAIVTELESRARVAMIFIDACRNNPLAENLEAAVSGLAPVEPAGDGTLIAFAAAPGRVAFDGAGTNSPFTLGLLDHLGDAGAGVEVAFKRVMRDVRDATNNRQSPQFVSSLSIDFFFGEPTAPMFTEDQASVDYERAERIGSVRAWHLYIEKYPEGFLTEMAREALQQALSEFWNAEDAIDPEDAEVALDFSKNARLEVQLALSDLGYDLGVPDGVLGPKSRLGISAFQRAAGLRETGFLGFSVLAELGIPFERQEVSKSVSGRSQLYLYEDLAALETDERLLTALKCIGNRPVSYGLFGGHVYVAIRDLASSAAGLALAKRCNGHFATIASSAENQFVLSMVSDDPAFWDVETFEGEQNSFGPMIGLVQRGGPEPDGGWQWITGEPMTFSNWEEGQPDEWNNGREDIGSYATFNSTRLRGQWNDTPHEDAAIIEFE